jgi:hypothetical protein
MCFVIYLLLFICAYSQGKEKKEASPLGEVFFLKKGCILPRVPGKGHSGKAIFKKKQRELP